jgi:DNA primase
MEGLFVKTVAKGGNYKLFKRLEITDRSISKTQGRSSQFLCVRDPKYLNWPLPSLIKSECAEYELDRARGKRKKMKALVTEN